MPHNNQKKIAGINDISGFGRCSTTVSMPIISYMKVQYCPILTSIFSNHTGYKEYFFDDYTDKMEAYIAQWKKLDLEFEGIYTGFLGSLKQIEIVKQFVNDFKTDRTTVIVDPVMGDNGEKYATYTSEMCNDMKQLVSMADIITPNITEGCILTKTDYKSSKWTIQELTKMAEKLAAMGPKKIVITGLNMNSYIGNFIYQKNMEPILLKSKKIGMARCGTGDIFSAIISADAINEVEFQCSVKKAAAFVQKCIKVSIERQIPETDGVCFEEVLHTLKIK